MNTKSTANVPHLIITEKQRRDLEELGLTEAEVREVIEESRAGKLPTIGRGIKRTERTKDERYVYVEYVLYNDEHQSVALWNVDTSSDTPTKRSSAL